MTNASEFFSLELLLLPSWNGGNELTKGSIHFTGHPAPKVRWWRGESLLESNNLVNEEDAFVESELVIRKISRSHLKAVYTCQASNNNISTPQATSVTLDLYRKYPRQW